MRYSLLLVALFVAMAVTACEQQGDINEPVSSGDQSTLLRAVASLDLSNEQLAQIDEMYYLEEDLSNLLSATQLSALNTIINSTGASFTSHLDRGHLGFDIAAMRHLSLIVQANPDIDETTREALLTLIQESNARRLQIIADYKDDPETMRSMLEAEHDALIAAMNALLTAEQLTNVETLKAELEQLREERRALWNAQRIELMVQYYTEKLGLSDEQAEQIRKLLTTQYAKIEEIRAANEGDPEALREALEQLLSDTNDEIYALLTDEQKAIWDEMRKLPMRWRPGGHHHRR